MLLPEFTLYLDQLEQFLVLHSQLLLAVIRQLLEEIRVAHCESHCELGTALLK